MFYKLCNESSNATLQRFCEEMDKASLLTPDTEWPLERVVSMVVPVCFGIIGLGGLMGNALVILGM